MLASPEEGALKAITRVINWRDAQGLCQCRMYFHPNDEAFGAIRFLERTKSFRIAYIFSFPFFNLLFQPCSLSVGLVYSKPLHSVAVGN